MNMSETAELDHALATLSAIPGEEYVYLELDEIPTGVQPFAVLNEGGYYTVVLERSQAAHSGLPVDNTFTQITINLDADLDSIGITSAIAQVLTARSITTNVMSCARHDHLFVRTDRAQEAVALLQELAKNAQGWLPRP